MLSHIFQVCSFSWNRTRELYVCQMHFEDRHTHDEFDIDVNEWVVSGPEDEGWREYPVLWPGVEPPPGWNRYFILINFFNFSCSTYKNSQVKSSRVAFNE